MEQDPASPRTYRVVPSRSAIIVKARSNVGPIAFATGDIDGAISAAVDESGLMVDSSVTARLEIQLNTLASGNSLYDAELMRRVDARRFPLAVVDLTSSSRLGATDDFDLKGNLTVHGVTRPINGKAAAEMTGRERITVDGEQIIDIRDFALGLPSTLMLKIYPDVSIEMHLEAEFAAQT